MLAEAAAHGRPCWTGCGRLCLDESTRMAELATGRTRDVLPLTRIEFDVLLLLAKARGQAVKREVLLDAVWGRTKAVQPHALESIVAKLRRKLGPKHRAMLCTVYRVGYRLREPLETPCGR